MIDANHSEVVLWGTLRRKAPDTWVWIDGTPEPAVKDMLAESAYDFRRRQYTDITLVEVPVYAVREDQILMSLT